MALLEAADRVIRRFGPAASMEQIAAEAGIAKPILYRYFGDKGGLYNALLERYSQPLMEAIRAALGRTTEAPQARIAATIEAYLAFVESEREVYGFLMHRAVREQPETQVTVAEFVRQVAVEVAPFLREEFLRFGADPAAAEPWAYGLVGMVQLAGDWWIESRSMPRAALVDHLVAMVWGGFSRVTEDQASRIAVDRPGSSRSRAPRRSV
jgi:AcrR family transcriptional regulator